LLIGCGQHLRWSKAKGIKHNLFLSLEFVYLGLVLQQESTFVLGHLHHHEALLEVGLEDALLHSGLELN
jgi:hypothetical protein